MREKMSYKECPKLVVLWPVSFNSTMRTDCVQYMKIMKENVSKTQ